MASLTSQVNIQRLKYNVFVLSPTHVGAIILRSLKTAVELVDEAVITVPAYFSNSQRASTKMAGKTDHNLARRYKDCRLLLAGKGKSNRKEITLCDMNLSVQLTRRIVT